MGCRFPDADDPAALLDVVLTGRRAFRRLPPCRVDLLDYYSADPATPDATYSTRAALLEGWSFDWQAFGVTEAVYRAADPAHWLALETAARALAAAGFPGGNGLALQRTGVIIGNTLTGDSSRAAALRLRWPYVRRVLADALASGDIPRDRAALVLRHAATRYLAPFPGISDETLAGSMPATIAARICSHFGFKGGSHAVDGSSASSLLAVAAACAALATGDLDVALAGGVDLSLDPFELVGLAKTGVLASGDMRIYDENPTGFLPGEGCGVLVLMRAADARSGGLPIYAEIAGWGVSSAGQAGHAESDASSQLLALNRAYQRAQIDPADVQLIEGHGAGTQAGDAAELTALAQLRAGARQRAALGSIKANIGHTKAAAGSAGLIKTVLAVSTGLIPPTTGFTRPHPMLQDAGAVLWLPPAAAAWPDGAKIAGVSAMGTGGGNAHLVLRGHSDQGRHKRKSRPARPGETTETILAAAQAAQPADGLSRTAAYLLHAPDRKALLPVLARIAQISPWLSDAEMRDLACQLARDARDQGPVRMAIVASRQEQLARLATDAMTTLPRLADGLLAVRPGVYTADGGDGRVTLLLSGHLGGPTKVPGGAPVGSGAADTVFSTLSALRWLELLGVHGTAAVGHGLGDLAGLAWAGCITEEDAAGLANRLAEILATAQAQHSGPAERATQLRAAAAKLRLSQPHRRLISAATGREVASIPDVTEVLCAQLDRPAGVEQALKTGAVGASLLLEAGPGRALRDAASDRARVPVVNLSGSGSGKDTSLAVAALFAAGALGRPEVLVAGQSARRIDIWREQVFITNPCQAEPAEQAAPAVRPPRATAPAAAAGPVPAARAAAPKGGPAADGRAAPAARPIGSVTGQPGSAMRGPRPASDARSGPGTGRPTRASEPTGFIAGVAPWVRCFAEQLRPLDDQAAAPPPAERRWRIRAATREPFRPLIPQLFDDDPAADRILAIVPDPADPGACVAALLAAQDAISVGQLVVVTHGPGFTGFYASLHAEHPALGITVLRVPESADGLRAAQRFATVEPGRFLELVIDVAGRPHETSMAPVTATGNGAFPLGPADVVLVSRGSDGSGLALAQVLACCGAAIAVIGQDDPGRDGGMLAGLDTLRSAGARVASEVADLADQTAIAAAVRRIERKLGLVTAIVQAAEPSAPKPLSTLTETELRTQAAAQAAVLNRLMGAVRPERIRLIVTFGSIAGRYGMGRAGLLALASGSLASQAERTAETIPGCQALHIDWPAWSGSEQDEPHGVPDRLARAGVTLIPVNEGSRLLLKMLTTPDFPASVAVHGRIGLLGRPPAAWRWSGRFLQAVRAYYPGVELVCEARISVRTDPYLADYLIDGQPVLPTAMALEAMAQAASVLTGGPVRRAVGMSVDSPVVVPTSGTDPGAVIRICALRDGDTVTVVMRSDGSGFAVDHVRAVFSCEVESPEAGTRVGAALPELDEVPASDAGIVDGTELYGPVCFQSGRFRRAALLPEVTSRSCRALVRGGDDQPWFSGPGGQADAQLILGSPGLTDATWHVLQACIPHRRLQLAGCDSVLFSGLAADGAVEVRAAIVRDPLRQAATDEVAVKRKSVIPRQGPGPDARPRPATSGEFVWDVEAVDAAGRPLVTWSGLRLRDAGPLPRTAAWPPALLAAYLERSTAALGLDPELRVTVQCAPQDGSGLPQPPGPVVPKPALPADEPTKAAARSASGSVETPGSGGSPAPAGTPAAAGTPAPAGRPGPARPARSSGPGDPLGAVTPADGSPPTHTAPGSGALEGYALSVWAPESAVCAWAAAGQQNRPAAGPATLSRPGAAQRGAAERGAAERGAAEPRASQAGAAEPTARQRGTTKPGTTKSGSAEPGTTKSSTTKSGTTKSGSAEPGSAEPGSAEPGSAEPGSAEPGSAEPGNAEPGSTKPRTTKSGTTKSGTAEAGIAKPGTEMSDTPLSGTEMSGSALPGGGIRAAGPEDAEIGRAEPAVAGGIQDDMRKRLSESPDVVEARLSAVAGCLAAAEARVSSATVVGDGLADDGWVLVRAGGATIACTVVELSGIPRPVAIAIMTGTPGKGKRQPVAASQPRSQSRRQRSQAAKHSR